MFTSTRYSKFNYFLINMEALQENFSGTPDNKTLERTDPVRHSAIRKENEKLSKVQDR